MNPAKSLTTAVVAAFIVFGFQANALVMSRQSAMSCTAEQGCRSLTRVANNSAYVGRDLAFPLALGESSLRKRFQSSISPKFCLSGPRDPSNPYDTWQSVNRQHGCPIR